MLVIGRKFSARHAVIGMAMFVAATQVPAETGVTDGEIYFGQSTALTGALAKFDYDSSIAAKTYFDSINAEGGIHGRKIRLVTLDDGDYAKQGVENTKLLIEKEQVFVLFNMSGTATNVAIMPLISAAAIPNIAPNSGAKALR